MIPNALKFGVNATDKVDCGAFAAISVPAAATWAAWFMPTAQADAAHRLIAKGTMQMSYANASNNRVVFEAPRATTFIRALAEAASFSVNWATHLGTPVFMAGTLDLASGLPKLYMGDLLTPASEPSAYVTQTLGSGAGTDTTGNNLTLGGIGSVPLKGSYFWAYVATAVYDLGEIQRLQFNPHQNYRNCAGRWRLGANGTGLVLDDSGNGNKGTITGAVPTSDNLPRVGHRRVA
jgi:hypothetical protein